MDSFGFGININLNNQFSSGFDGIARQIATMPSIVNSSLDTLRTLSDSMLKPFQAGILKAAEFSDINADIMKTTGQSLAEVANFSKELEKIDTRTSLGGLLEIAKIGGSIGVATDQMLGFTNSIDMANVALGDEFKGGAEQITKELGTLKNLFDTTKAMDYGLAMSSIGSAINELGAVGLATGPNLTDFAKRMGQLGQIAPSLEATLGLGATLEELGLRSEVAAGGLSNVLLVAGENATAFSKQLGLSLKEFREIYSDKPEEIIMRLGQSFKGLDEVGVAQKLKELKIGSQESIKVFSSLKDNTILLEKRMGLAGDAFNKNTSLSKEFGIKNNTLAASFQKVDNVLEVLSKNIGESLSGAVQPFSDGFVDIGKKVSEFIQTPLGNTFTQIAAGLAVATVGIAAFTLATTIGIPMLGTFAAAAWAAVAPLLPFAAGAAILAAELYFLKESYDSFTDVMNGGAKADGFLGFMQKVGGVLKGISAIFDTVSKDGFSFSEELQQSLEKVGILDFVVSIGTIAVRIQAFFGGFATGFNRLSAQFSGVFGVFEKLGTSIGRIFDNFDIKIGNNTSSLSVWGTIGETIFNVLSIGITRVLFFVETFANVLNFVLSVGLDFFDGFDKGIANLGKRWDELINGIVDSIKNLPLGETALKFLGLGGTDTQDKKSGANLSTIDKIDNPLLELDSPQNKANKPTQMKEMLNQSAKRENEKVNMLRTSPQQPQTTIVNVPPANYNLFIDNEPIRVKVNESNRLDNNRD